MSVSISDRLKQIDSESVEDWDNMKESGELIDDFWNPRPEGEDCNVGVEMKGIYLGKRSFTGADGPFEKIVLKATDGKVYGLPTFKLLADAIVKIDIGDGLWIKYLGKKKASKGPNSFHDFEIKAKRYNDGVKGYSKSLGNKEEPKAPAPEMAQAEDPEALSTIESYAEIYKADNYGKMPKAQDIKNYIDSDPDLNESDKARVIKALVELIKKGDIKE